MKERGLLLTAENVRATIEGRKTATRRTRGLEVINEEPDRWKYLTQGLIAGKHLFERDDGYKVGIKCPYGAKGDGLWIRETWMPFGFIEPLGGIFIHYKADGQESSLLIPEGFDRTKLANKVGKWQPAMFMYRWMSRLPLGIVAEPIPQRLWDITEKDAIAEGVEPIYEYPNEHMNKALAQIGAKPVTTPYIIGWKNYLYKIDKRYHYGNPNSPEWFISPIRSYESLWDSINIKKHPWSGNWWAWVIEYNKLNNI